MSYSQFNQDLWVLNYFSKGFFIDVGCADGENGSNTKLLEEKGWKGLGIDPFPRNFEYRKNTKIEIGCVYKENKDIEFICANDLGGVKEHVKAHINEKLVIEAKTKIIPAKTLEYFLDKNNISKNIEYLSLDTEGSEYEILSVFPFKKYKFGCMTIEHNYEQDKRHKIHKLLLENDYLFIKSLNVDDCFIHKSLN